MEKEGKVEEKVGEKDKEKGGEKAPGGGSPEIPKHSDNFERVGGERTQQDELGGYKSKKYVGRRAKK
jgi:hypothetical protein